MSQPDPTPSKAPDAAPTAAPEPATKAAPTAAPTAALTVAPELATKPAAAGPIALDALLARPTAALRQGPVALVFDEDGVALADTVAHCCKLGFAAVLVFSPDHRGRLDTPAVIQIDGPRLRGPQMLQAVNAVIAALPGVWLHYCYNAEFLHFPFCETRSIAEMLAFHAEEKRDAMLTYVVDLYASNLTTHPDAVDLQDCYFDRSGYYAQQRVGADAVWLDRQWDFRGGLRWRYEEHVPPDKRRIDRIGLFRAKAGVQLFADHTLSEPEMNTVSCPWHHNLTATICSFRVAKALRANPGSREAIGGFIWQNASRFEWRSQQLMDLGLMEPGQWF